jgi:hypothetical protein
MHFALLLPQLPHLNENPAQYSGMLTVVHAPNFVRAATLSLRAAMTKLFG